MTNKVRKLDQAIEIFKRHLPARGTLSKKEFRAAVVADFKKELGLTNAGTIGMYFGQADQLVSGRAPKQYNRTAPRQTTKTVAARKSAAVDDAKLNALAASFNATIENARSKKAARKTVAKKPDDVSTTDNETKTTTITGKSSKKKPQVKAL